MVQNYTKKMKQQIFCYKNSWLYKIFLVILHPEKEIVFIRDNEKRNE